MILQAMPYPAGISPPAIDSDYAYVADIDTGQVYYRKDENATVVPASITKLMTALIVMQEKGGALSSTVTVAAGDLTGLAGFSQMGLAAGDVITYTDLLYGILLPSGSEACQAAARAIGNDIDGGGVTTFLSEMNTLAASLGMTGTDFSNTWGDDDSGANYSTAIDLWRLVKAAQDNATLAAIMDKAVYTATITGSGARAIFLSNSNPILEDEGVIGSKTGTYLGLVSDPAIYNLGVAWTAPNGQRVGIVTLHADTEADRQSDQRAIIAQLPIDYPSLAVSIAPDNGAGSVLLENETDTVLLEDGTSELLLEG